MFTTGQNISEKPAIISKQLILPFGTALAKSRMMKRRFTYKEITMIMGVLVALVIAFTLWASGPRKHSGPVPFPPAATPGMNSPLIRMLSSEISGLSKQSLGTPGFH